MIPKTFLLAFLSLQSSNGPQTSGEGNSEVAIQIDVLEPAIALQGAEYGPEKAVNRIDYLSTPRVQTGGNADDDAQVPLKISSGQGEVVIQRGYKEFNFNKFPIGDYNPDKVSLPDGIEILAQPHTYSLKDAFPHIHLPEIKVVWGTYPAGGHFAIFGPRLKNVSIEFGWIENGAFTAGRYESQIWTLTAFGWKTEKGPSESFKGLGWETTKNIEAEGNRFIFDFSGGPSDKVLVVSRVFYDLA